MWRVIITFVVCLVCLFSIKAQTVVENESSILLNEKTADVSLVVDSPNKNSTHKVTLELLDANDVVRSQISVSQQLKQGKETYKLQLPLNDLLEKNQSDISWFRLRYQIGDTRGIVSLSQIVKDIFEIRVIASENILTGMTYRNRIRAVSPFNNQAVQGVKVNANLILEQKDETKINLTAQGETDNEGFVDLEFQIPVEANLDDAEIKVTGRKNGIVREATEDLQTLGDDFQFPMMADKPIYQPEQMLNVRGILLKGGESKTVVVDAEVEFRVEDEEETVLYREKVKTSAFGVASMSWKIPENAKLGQYRIRVKNQSNDEGEYVGYQSIKISRYDLPNFAVNAKALKPYYLPSENQAEVEVNADYLFGKPVTKGKVRVVRETERTWNYKQQKYDINEGESHEGKTDENGKYTAKFELKDDHEDLKASDYQKFRDLTFTAYFTDLTTNRTEQRRFDVRVTKEQIHVYFIGNTSDNHANLPINAYVSAFYADGAPCLCEIELKGREDSTDEKFKTILKTKTNSLGGGKLNFYRPKFEEADLEDDLDIQIIAKDKNGLRGTFGNDEEDDYYYDKEIGFEDKSKLQIEIDKTIFKAGEAVKIKLNTAFAEDKAQLSAKIYVDIVKGWSVVESYFVTLKNGKGELKIPYQPKFQGALKIAAYFEEERIGNNYNYQSGRYENSKYFELVKTSRGVIFPHSENLKLDAKFDKETYKPAEEATATFSVLDSIGQVVESVLGIVIFDKAVEERARTEGDFNGAFKSYYGWLGYGDAFGGINVKDLNDLDLSKPISDEMQLAAEIMLYDDYYYPNIFRSRTTATDAKSVYAEYFKKQFEPLEKKLMTHYGYKNFEHPTDTASFNKILGENGVVFEDLRDPWGNNYRAVFEVEKINDIVRIISAGADKKFETDDDFTVSSSSFIYFTPTAKSIDKAIKDFHARTGGHIRDEKTLFVELGISELKDRFNRPYRIGFYIDGRNYALRIFSSGKNGVNDGSSYDDFEVYYNYQNYFLDTELKINQILQKAQKMPMSEAELKSLLKANGVDLDEFRDGWSEKIYLIKREFSRFDNVYKEEIVSEYGKEATTKRRVIIPVTQGLISFSIRSKGADKKDNTSDDFTLAEFAKVIWEQSKDDQMRRSPTENYPYAQGTASINGTIKDVAGAVISGAKISLINENQNSTRTVITSEDGKYLFSNIMPAIYTLTIEAKGFKTKTLRNITASVNTLLTGDFVLEVETINGSTVFHKVSSDGTGSISGDVRDSQGAAIPGATITATNTETSISRSVATDDNGKYLIGNLTAGTYDLKVVASGFKSWVTQNVPVTAGGIVKYDVTLEIGSVNAVVEISSGAVTMETTNASVGTVIGQREIQSLPINGRNFMQLVQLKPGVTKGEEEDTQTSQKSTPKLREYFPETLVWSPELITNKDGKAELKFKMADSITTWKLYTIASTKNGKFGVAEKEVTAFQPFFVDLEPPKFLTESDEIYLPVQVRNYTSAKQKVDVTMAKADWFSFLSPELQKIEVDKNAAKNAVFGFKAISPIKDGKQRVTAIATKDSDAIEKPVTVRPNGEEIVQTESKLFANSAAFEVNFPENILPKTAKAELKIYPNLLAHVTESVEGLLRRPYGCGEQTISSTYPNLMILKFGDTETRRGGDAEKKADDSAMPKEAKKDSAEIPASPRPRISASLQKNARKFLQKGYERLLGYQISDGGFSYWGGKDSSDIALTAYALRFLNDAKSFIEVDQTVIKNATVYLLKQQRADGSFTKKYYWETTEDEKRTKMFTSYVAKTLASLKADKPTLDKALNYLKTHNSEIDEPYALALYGLANFDAGNIEEARNVAQRLSKLAKNEDGATYWNLETNTPFYGWGTAGRIETTALVIQLLTKVDWKLTGLRRELVYSELIEKGFMFMLKNKDRYGVWYSTQTTINVLDTFLEGFSISKERQTISVSINGEKLNDFIISADQIEPITVPLSDKLASANRLEIKTSDNSQVMAQIVKTHYIDWKDSVSTNRNINDSRAIKLDYKCDKLNPKIMETVTCSVAAERIGFQGYGMLLAEIGIPPGADISRESLEKEFENDWSLSRYEVLPDRIIVYMWAKAGGSKFNFTFKPRYGINAQTPMSIVYDYYNEESRGVVAPLKFEVN